MLRCENGKPFGVLINNRWLEVLCRDEWCRKDGVQTVHRWDLQTLHRSTFYRPLEPPGG
jgi:hypothetical protein